MNSEPVIHTEDLSYTYPDGTEALRGISFRVMPGERVAFVGANGAGKSTLLLHLNGILRGEGAIRILGLPVEKEHLREIRRKVGLVFQNPDDQLFCPTVEEDVAFGPRNMGLEDEEIDARVKKSLQAVGMSGFEKRSAHHLSLGQKKRVCLATVLSMEPEIFAFDEPTANLDPKGRKEIEGLLERLEGKTLVVISHDVSQVRKLCGRVLILHEGRLAADGPPSILDDPALLGKTNLA
jgi:cobalt/nickel transport system ATP-binding protein